MYDVGNPDDRPSAAPDPAAPSQPNEGPQPTREDRSPEPPPSGGATDTGSESAASTTSPRDRATQLHKHICEAVLVERRAMREIALGLAELQRDQLFRDLSYASLAEYGEQALGFMADKTRQLARIGRHLPQLPVLDQAFRSGILGWTRARCVVQVATAETERVWVERALQVNTRDLEDLVSGTCHGKPPPEPEEDWNPPRHVWARFRLDPFHFERLMHVLALLRHDLGDPDLSSSQLLLHLAEQWLEGVQDDAAGSGAAQPEGESECADSPLVSCEDGRCEGPETPAHVYCDSVEASAAARGEEPEPAVHVCCDTAEASAAARDEEPESAVHVCCDRAEVPATARDDEAEPAVHVCCGGEAGSHSGSGGQRLGNPAVTAARGENAYPVNYRIIEHRCPSCERAWLETRAGRIELDERTRALIECDAGVVAGDDSAGTPGHLSRTIPPATRRAVLIRDHGCCTVPGCRHNKYLDLHHIKWRTRGGSHNPLNLATVCAAHHGMIHNGVLRVSRGADGELQWERGAGEPLGIIVSIWGESAEADHASLQEFEGPPGSWGCIKEYWGDIEPPEGFGQAGDAAHGAVHVCDTESSDATSDGSAAMGASSIRERYPRGWQSFRIGDETRMAPGWMVRPIR